MLRSFVGLVALVSLSAVACSAPVPDGAGDGESEKPLKPLFAISQDALDSRDAMLADPAPEGEDGAEQPWTPAELVSPFLSELNGFYFVVEYGQPLLVLETAIDMPAGAAVPIAYHTGDSAIAAWAPFEGDVEALGSRAREGQEVVLYRADGLACFATTRRPVVLYRDAPDSEPNSAERFAARVPEEAPSSQMLVAPLDVKGGDCQGALFARPSTLSTPRLYVPQGEPVELGERDVSADVPWASAALAATRASVDHADTQKAWDREREDESTPDRQPLSPSPIWDEAPHAERTAQRFVEVDGEDSYVALAFGARKSCDDCDHRLWSAVHRSAGGAAVGGAVRDFWGPLTMVDIDDDGTFEVLGAEVLYVHTELGWHMFRVPDAYWVCTA